MTSLRFKCFDTQVEMQQREKRRGKENVKRGKYMKTIC